MRARVKRNASDVYESVYKYGRFRIRSRGAFDHADAIHEAALRLLTRHEDPYQNPARWCIAARNAFISEQRRRLACTTLDAAMGVADERNDLTRRIGELHDAVNGIIQETDDRVVVQLCRILLNPSLYWEWSLRSYQDARSPSVKRLSEFVGVSRSQLTVAIHRLYAALLERR